MKKQVKPIKYGVIGLGWGQSHVKQAIACADAELVAVADMHQEKRDAVCHEHGIKGYASAEDMLAKENLDIVSIAVPNVYHHELSIMAMQAGCHVLCEKPMSTNLANAKKMLEAARNYNRKLAINFSFRFSPMSFALKSQVDAGVIGDVYFGRTVWRRRRGIPKFGGWFGQKALSGGGPLIDLGVHRIDLALWLMGHPNPVSVYGSTYDTIGQRMASEQKKDFDVEDLAAGIVKFDNGATLIVEASWAMNNNRNEHMITELYGTAGGVVQKNVGQGYDFTAEIYTEEQGNLYTKTLDKATQKVPSSVDEIVAAVLEDRQPMHSAEDGLRVQKILNGLYESASKGREVKFKSGGHT